MAVLTRLVLVAVLVTSCSVEGIRISMAPTTIVDGKTPSLSIRCDTDAPSGDTVYAIKIYKSPITTHLAIVDEPNGQRVDPSIQQRATATGAVTVAAESYLVLTFTDAISCNDQGDYVCDYYSEWTSLVRNNQTLQAVSDPSNIAIVPRPNRTPYLVDDMVELLCSGNVGKPVIGNWTWETRHVSLETTWTPLRPGLIPEDETPAASGLCQMTGRSTLIFQVQMEDDNRMYRCYFRDPVYSANFTFQVHG